MKHNNELTFLKYSQEQGSPVPHPIFLRPFKTDINHIWDKHREHFGNKLNNLSGGVIKSVSPDNLDRAEDYFVYSTKADTMGLNRYKVLA